MIYLFSRHPVTHPEKIQLDPQNLPIKHLLRRYLDGFWGKRSMSMKKQQRKKPGGDGTIILKMAKPF